MMDPAEQNQPEPQDASTPKENPHEVFKQTLETSSRAMDALADFATQNGVSAERFPHLTKVFDPDGHILLPPIETMRRELVRMHGESDRTSRTRALTAHKTGQVFVPEEQAGSIHDTLHESIHRAAWLNDRQLGLSTNTSNIANQLASRYGITIAADGKVDPNSEYIKQFASTEEERNNLIQFFTETLKEETTRVTEGITEWTTQRANGMTTSEGTRIRMENVDMAYGAEVQYINDVKSKLISEEGITEGQADAKIIGAAQTGDVGELLPYL